MTWATVKEAIRVAVGMTLSLPDFAGADGNPVAAVAWANQREAQRWAVDGKWADLTAVSVRGKGWDETRTETIAGVTPALDVIRPTYAGYRLVNVTVHIGGASQEDAEDAFFLGGKLRTRLRRPDVLAVLQAGGAAVVDIGGSLDVDYRDQNGRMQSCALVELRFAFVESDTDTTEASSEFVNELSDALGTVTGSGVDHTLDVSVVGP